MGGGGAREAFDAVAERYDRVRPWYPPALVAELARLGGLGPGSRVLEPGPGTGRLTVPLARLGCRITGVELGPALAAVAARNLRPYPAARVVAGAFEEWPLPAEPFDALVCATAYHWLDPAVRTGRAADALRPGGLLAVVTTQHVAGGTEAFFADAQRAYERWDPATPPGLRLTPESELVADTAEFTDDARFTDVRVRGFPQEITYSADRYAELLLTYANHLLLPPAARDGLLGEIRELADRRYGGRITKRYLHELVTARRTAGPPPARPGTRSAGRR